MKRLLVGTIGVFALTALVSDHVTSTALASSVAADSSLVRAFVAKDLKPSDLTAEGVDPARRDEIQSRLRGLIDPEAEKQRVAKQRADLEKQIAAMEAIEDAFPPLKGQLPKDYARFEAGVLEDMMRMFDSEGLRSASGDVFGRILSESNPGLTMGKPGP